MRRCCKTESFAGFQVDIHSLGFPDCRPGLIDLVLGLGLVIDGCFSDQGPNEPSIFASTRFANGEHRLPITLHFRA